MVYIRVDFETSNKHRAISNTPELLHHSTLNLSHAMSKILRSAAGAGVGEDKIRISKDQVTASTAEMLKTDRM